MVRKRLADKVMRSMWPDVVKGLTNPGAEIRALAAVVAMRWDFCGRCAGWGNAASLPGILGRPHQSTATGLHVPAGDYLYIHEGKGDG
jgi:hypothetical protein